MNAAAHRISLQILHLEKSRTLIQTKTCISCFCMRFMTVGNGKGGKGEADPFGVNFRDTMDNIGPNDSLPPNYVRDAATGKLTGEIQAEISEAERKLVNLSPFGKENLLRDRFEESLKGGEGEEGDHLPDQISLRIREEKESFNTIGRKVSDVKRVLSDTENKDDSNSTAAPLSQNELSSLYRFINHTTDPSGESEHGNFENFVEDSSHLVPVVSNISSRKEPMEKPSEGNPDLDLQWMSISATRDMSNVEADDIEEPFAHLVPSDLNPAKKVNRKHAKPIPKELLHHNNLSLLRRYTTPGGQIMDRVQSRLGAKDQRKIAKLIKRARHLGLIPVLGQWKYEDNGDCRDQSIFEDTEWEKMLLERGFMSRKSPLWEKMKTEKIRSKTNPSPSW